MGYCVSKEDLVMADMIKIATEWWRDQLTRTDFEQFVRSPEDPDESALFIVAHLLKAKVSKKYLANFTKTLGLEMMGRLNRGEVVELYTKQWPCELLEHIGNRVGISGNNFPWFLWMKVEKYKVTVKYGLRFHEEVIFSEELTD